MPINYFLYARKSTESEEQQILSIEAQLTELRLFAGKEKIHIKEEFIESKTAKVPGRPIFNQMIERIKKGEAQGILAWHPDRLARNSVDGGQIIYFLDTCQIQSLKFPTFWFENTPQGKFMMNIAFGQSKYYVDNLSENVKRGNRQKLRNGGWPVRAPLGYLNDKLNRTIVIDPVRGHLVAKMFKEYATGNYTIKGLIAASKEWGLVSRGKSGKLSNCGIQTILMNPFYYGLMRYNNEYHQGKHEPLISKELFDRVQEVINSRGKNHEVRKHHFAFLGLATCPCGCAITGERQKGHNYYRCTRKKGPCKEPYTREELLDQQISKAIKDIAISPEEYRVMLAHLAKDKISSSQMLQKEKARLQKPLQEAKGKLEKLLDLHLEGVISTQEYSLKKETLLNRKIALEEQFNKIERDGNIWLEPASEFFRAAHQAHQLSASKNLAAKKDFTRKIGSNFRLSSRTLCFSYTFPWGILKKSRPINNMWALQDLNL